VNSKKTNTAKPLFGCIAINNLTFGFFLVFPFMPLQQETVEALNECGMFGIQSLVIVENNGFQSTIRNRASPAITHCIRPPKQRHRTSAKQTNVMVTSNICHTQTMKTYVNLCLNVNSDISLEPRRPYGTLPVFMHLSLFKWCWKQYLFKASVNTMFHKPCGEI